MSKKQCTNCTHFKNNVCVKNGKNGYFNCKKYKAIPMEELIKERNSLLGSKDNPKRLEFLTNKIIEFNGGVL